jgi:mRNA interferase HigB
VRTISQKPLKAFWTKHADAEEELKAWYRVAKKAKWEKFEDVRRVYKSVDQVGECLVFNIRHNNYRLIVKVRFDWAFIFVCQVLTHKEYDRDTWKKTCEC